MEEEQVKKLHVTYTAGRTPQKVNVQEQDTRQMQSKKITQHAIICICILCTCMLLRSIDTPWSTKVQQGIATALTFDIDSEETLGRLKFVQMQLEDTVTAFAAETTGQTTLRCMPVQGAVLRRFCDGEDHVLLNVQSYQSVVSPDAGIVSDATQTSIAIDFSDGSCCVIGKLGQVQAEAGMQVSCGEQIALSDGAGTPIAFYVYRNGMAIDPCLWAEEKQ